MKNPVLSVPEGRTDRSQAVYCLECIQTATRPVGYGVIGYYRRLNLRGCAWVFHLEAIPAGVTIHTVPYGTDLFLAVSLAINCQATII